MSDLDIDNGSDAEEFDLTAGETDGSSGLDVNPGVREFLKDHPRILGALFGLLVLLAEVGSVAAGEGRAISGI
jgi:hypothetical protein